MKNFSRFLFAFVMVFVLFVGVAHAAGVPGVGPTESPALSRLINSFIEILAAVAGILATALVGKLLMWFHKKTGIEVPAHMEAQFDKWADEGIHFAEEQAHKAIKNNEAKLPSSKMLDTALGYGLDMADKFKLKDMAKDVLVKKIEARLNMKRAAATNGVLE